MGSISARLLCRFRQSAKFGIIRLGIMRAADDIGAHLFDLFGVSTLAKLTMPLPFNMPSMTTDFHVAASAMVRRFAQVRQHAVADRPGPWHTRQ